MKLELVCNDLLQYKKLCGLVNCVNGCRDNTGDIRGSLCFQKDRFVLQTLPHDDISACSNYYYRDFFESHDVSSEWLSDTDPEDTPLLALNLSLRGLYNELLVAIRNTDDNAETFTATISYTYSNFSLVQDRTRQPVLSVVVGSHCGAVPVLQFWAKNSRNGPAGSAIALTQMPFYSSGIPRSCTAIYPPALRLLAGLLRAASLLSDARRGESKAVHLLVHRVDEGHARVDFGDPGAVITLAEVRTARPVPTEQVEYVLTTEMGNTLEAIGELPASDAIMSLGQGEVRLILMANGTEPKFVMKWLINRF